MSYIISVNAGHGGSDPGAVGTDPRNGQRITEAETARYYKDRFIEEGKRRGYTMHDSTSATGSTNEQADKANAAKADIAISLHLNAGGGTGVEVFRWELAQQSTKDLCAEISKAWADAYGFMNRGQKSDRTDRLPLGMNFIRRTNMLSMLIEMAFIDNASDLNKIFADPEKGIRAVWDVIEKRYPVAKPPPVTPPPSVDWEAKYYELLDKYTANEKDLAALVSEAATKDAALAEAVKTLASFKNGLEELLKKFSQ